MKKEKSAGLIVFRRKREKVYYLLLHYEAGHWGFPKGNFEEGENLFQTACRELQEETGIENIDIKTGFKEWVSYFFHRRKKRVLKMVGYLLGKTSQKQVHLSEEHVGYKWLTYKQARQQLTFENNRELLKKTHQYLVS